MARQQLHTYFGLAVQVVRELEESKYKDVTKAFKTWLDNNPSLEHLDPELYIHRLQFDITPVRFKIKGIENRVSSLTVSVSINPKQRQKGTIRFFNHKIGHRLSPTAVQESLGDFENRYTLSGSQLTTTSHFEEYLATMVLKNVPRRDRKVKFTLSGEATPAYRASALKNVELPVITKLDFKLDRHVQLTLPLTAPRAAGHQP